MMKKILTVDDEKVIRDLVRHSLKDQGYEIHEADSGEEAIRKAREIKPHLVLLDLMLPDKWGYAVCEELKKDPETSSVPVVFLTGRGSSPSQKMAELKGGDGYIVKPFEPAELREKVRELIKD